MSFKEQLRDEILPKTVDYYNSGMDINSSIVKAAADFNLNVDQTDRLVETMNTARVIAHYEKNAEDRTSNCDIADKNEVHRMLFEDRTEKKASFGDTEYDYSAYGFDESDYRKAAHMEKAASEEKRPKATDGFTRKQVVDRVVKYASELEGRRRFAEEREAMSQSLIASRLDKVARMLSSGYEPEARYAIFKAAAAKKFPSAVREIDKVLRPDLIKSAGPHLKAINRSNVFDDSGVRVEVEMAKQIESDLKKVAELHSLVELVASRESEAKRLIADYHRVEKEAAAPNPPFPPPPQPNGGGDDDKDSKKDKDDPWLGKGVSGTWKATKAGLKAGIPEAPAGVKEIWNYLQGGGISSEKIDKAIGGSDKKDSKIKNYVDNVIRSSIISDLYANDPVLSEADPEAVTSAYQNLVDVAPQASLNKEIVRAVLRQSVNSVAVSPFDAKQWADLDNVLLKNQGKIGARA